LPLNGSISENLLLKRQFRGNLKDKTKAYLAGLFDSEGDLSIGRHFSKERTYTIKGKTYTYENYTSYSASIAVYNTYLPLMKYLVKHFGGTYRVLREETETRQKVYAWKPDGSKHSLTVLKLVSPYVVIKQSQLHLCIQFLELGNTSDPETRKNLYDECLLANSSSLTTDTNHIIEWKNNLQNAYFSAIFDGEGTAAVYNSPTIWIANSNKSLLETVKILFNANEVTGGNRKNAKVIRLPEYRVAVPVETMEKFILRILPYSTIKREQLLLTLEALRGVTKERKDEIQKKLFQIKHPLDIKIQSDLTRDCENPLMETLEGNNNNATTL
jgi:hypothetical protein